MAFDTKYRPHTYDDVLGQEAAVAVLRQFVKEDRGFHQSYVFCGQHGSGKTTLGRILARALLCENPQDGAPCDECHSCRVFLDGGTHECFEELDAATKSGKADLARIVEDVSYSSFSGNRKIYLFDESHRLSKQALDVLLKPMEDSVNGTEDKRLVCIFCTTEPEKMVSTIFSRCAPAFVIRAVPPEKIATRLAWVCDQEGIEYDMDALVTIADVSECHIRDALKTIEGVSMLGPIVKENVFKYLQLGANDSALKMVGLLGLDLKASLTLAQDMAFEISPSSAYERISEAALSAYRYHLGVGKVSSKWDLRQIEELAKRGPQLLSIASRFSNPPHRPTRQSLSLDVGTVHYAIQGKVDPSAVGRVSLEVVSTPSSAPAPAVAPLSPAPAATALPAPAPAPSKKIEANPAKSQGSMAANAAPAPATIAGVWIDPRAVGDGPGAPSRDSGSSASKASPGSLAPEVFKQLLQHHLQDLKSGPSGLPG